MRFLRTDFWAYLLTVPLVFTSCEPDTGPEVNCTFNQSAMLTNYADSLIVPGLENMRIGSLFLNAATQTYLTTLDAGQLVEIQVSYAAYFEAYKKVSMFGFGPGLINGAPFRNRFNTYPVNVAVIESNIAAAISTTDALPNDVVGFSAIAYLIFGEPGMTAVEVNALFQANPARGQYLLALTQELQLTSTQIRDGWSSYRSGFIENIGSADGASMSMLVNELNMDFETTKNYGFKVPLGKFNGGTVLPEKVEAYYSGGSSRLALVHITALRNVFLGAGAEDGTGLYEYLVCLNAGADADGLLADAIDLQFEQIITALNKVPDPMSATLVNNVAVVEEAHTHMQQLVPLFKAEMTSALGVRISYQDTDGD